MENTLNKDLSEGEEDALTRVYNLLRPGDPPNIETARGLLERPSSNLSVTTWVTLDDIVLTA